MGGEFPSALPMALFQLLWVGEASLSPFCAPKCPFRTFRCFAWLIHDFAPSPMRALVFRSAYSASRNARASAAFAASIKAHRAVSSETLMFQVRSAHPPMPHRTCSPSCAGVSHGLFGKPKRPDSSRFAVFMGATLCFFFQSAHAPGSLRSPSEPLSPGGRSNQLHPLRPSKPSQGVSGAAAAAPDSRGGKGRVKLSPTCTRPAAALNPCTK